MQENENELKEVENEQEPSKRIEVVSMRVGDLKDTFGNPRKITKKKKEELRQSLLAFGDFGVFLIDEQNQLIAGNQRASVLKEEDEDIMVTCKRLIGYTENELRAINIKDNTHAGDWDLGMLADWTADLNIDMGIKDEIKKELEERAIKEMELIRYEKYDYVIIACRYETDYNELTRKLGLSNAKVSMTKNRKIKARAIWYDEMKAQIVEKPNMIAQEKK